MIPFFVIRRVAIIIITVVDIILAYNILKKGYKQGTNKIKTILNKKNMINKQNGLKNILMNKEASKINILILEDNCYWNSWFKKGFPKADMTETVDGVKDFLSKKTYDAIFLDHDLNDTPFTPSGVGTGYEAAQLIATSTSNNAIIVVHSWNPVGANNICKILPNAIKMPFDPSIFKFEKFKD